MNRTLPALMGTMMMAAHKRALSTTATATATTMNRMTPLLRHSFHRCLSSSSTTTTSSQALPYHIEVSNLARKDVTQIVVTGPGVLGLLASLCVTLATQGGSIKELHAADSLKEEGGIEVVCHGQKPIRDVITVVDYQTGKAFADDQLHDLAIALLESTKAPKQVVAAVKKEMDLLLEQQDELLGDEAQVEGCLTVIKGADQFKHL